MRVGDDWMVAGQENAEPRDWSTRPAAEKKAEFVPEIEIAAALRRVIANAFGIESQEAARQAFALLGFQRVAETTRLRGEDVLRKLIGCGAVIERDGCVWPPEAGAGLRSPFPG